MRITLDQWRDKYGLAMTDLGTPDCGGREEIIDFEETR